MARPHCICSIALLIGLLLGALVPVARAKPLPVRFASDYQAENWDLEDGFPENSCSGILTSADGYMWIGTFRGLLRFNGQTFRPWGPDAFPALASTGVMAMHRDTAGRIWLSTLNGLYLNQGASWRHWTLQDGWADPLDHVRSFAENAAGDLVLTRHSGRVFRLEGNAFRELPLPPGAGGTLAGLDADGTLYYFRSGRAGWLVDGSWRELPGMQAVGATQARNGDGLIVGREELLRLRSGRVVGRLRLSEPVSAFWESAEEADGTLWLAAVDSGLYRIRPDGAVRHFRRADGLPYDGGTRAVYVAEDGIWIGSGVGGLTRFKPARVRFLDADENLPEREIVTLTETGPGRMLFAPYGAGLHVFEDGVVKPYKSGASIPLFCRSILQARDGTLWIGAYAAGLYRFDARTSRRVALDHFPEAGKEGVHSLFEDSTGRLWAGGERTVIRQNGAAFERVLMPGDPVRRPTIFAEGRDGSIFIGQHEQVYRYGLHGLNPAPVARLPAGARVSSMLVDAQDRLWIATAAHGLHVYTSAGVAALPAEAGLPSQTLGALVQDDAGMLWFGSGRNLVRADPADLALATRDPRHTPHILVFGREDGLRYLDFTYGTQPNVRRDSAGRLWFAMIRGVAMVDPRSVRVHARPPPVVVESVSYVPANAQVAVSVPVRDDAPLVLPPGSRMIKINYAALDFAAPKKQRFNVALDDKWQDMHDEGTASFLELPPGRHTFKVQARGSDGVWNRTGARLSFEIDRYFWQTTWFRVGAGAAVLGFVGAGIWLVSDRRTRIARENLARERTLAEARARLALVLENTSDFVAFFDDSGQLTYLNRAGQSLIGLAPGADIRRISVSSMFPAWADLIHQQQALPATLREGSWSGELALAKGSDEVPVSVLLIAHRDSAGALQFVSMIARDISEAKRYAQVQDALRNLATSLTAALSPATLGRAVADVCRLLFKHDAFFLARMAEGKVSDLRLCHAEDVFSANDAVRPSVADIPQRVARELSDVIAGASALCMADAHQPIPCQIGSEAMRSALYAPVRYAGKTIGVIAVQSARQRYAQADLEQLEVVAHHCAAAMARLNAEELLRRNEEHLRQSQKLEAVGTLAGGIAHDFNNILAAILGYAELARNEVSDTHPVRECVDKIAQSSLRARDLVRRILAFSRPQDVRHSVANVAAVAGEAVKLLRSTVSAIIDIDLHVAPGVPGAFIDSTELHQVLLNLGTNAVHALNESAGRIVYRVDVVTFRVDDVPPAADLKPGEYVRLRVEDTGCGIAPDILPKIFDPFFTTKPVNKGTGLGLSVAHGIVHSCGGEITVDTVLNAGTTFTLYLRAARENSVAVTLAPVESPSPATRAARRRLMIVDDEQMIVATLSALFTKLGYEVVAFGNPATALAEFQEDATAFDLLLTDFSMPGMTGATLAQACHELRPDLPIVLMSGYARGMDRKAAERAGIVEVVEKPVTVETLLSIVGRLLGVERPTLSDGDVA